MKDKTYERHDRKVRGEPFGEGTVDIVRVFDAPRALVWQAWTDPKMLAQWFGPRGFTASVPELDVRVGGAIAHRHARTGRQRLSDERRVHRGESAERLVFTNIPIDKDGNHLLEGETTITLTEQGGKTTMTMTSHMVGLVPIAPQMLAGMEAGWTQSIDKLQELVARTNRRQASIHAIAASNAAIAHSATAVQRLRRCSARPIASTVSGDSTRPSRVMSSS